MKIDNAECLIEFGSFIRQGREKLSLYQSDVAHSLGISQPYYSAIERGERNVDLVLALKICDLLKLNLNNYVSLFLNNK